MCLDCLTCATLPQEVVGAMVVAFPNILKYSLDRNLRPKVNLEGLATCCLAKGS